MLAYAAFSWLLIQQINNERKTMKPKMTTELAKLTVEALKVPHIAVLVGMLGMGVIFAYLK